MWHYSVPTSFTTKAKTETPPSPLHRTPTDTQILCYWSSICSLAACTRTQEAAGLNAAQQYITLDISCEGNPTHRIKGMLHQCKRHIDRSHHSTREGFSNIQHLSNGRRQAHPNSVTTGVPDPRTTPAHAVQKILTVRNNWAGPYPLDTIIHNTTIESSRKPTGSRARSIHAARSKLQVCVFSSILQNVIQTSTGVHTLKTEQPSQHKKLTTRSRIQSRRRTTIRMPCKTIPLIG
jgi:hypothetical protein